MKIVLNGQEKQFTQNQSLKNLIDQCCADNPYVIAEVNGHIIKNPHWNDTQLKDGDAVELVNFVGGG